MTAEAAAAAAAAPVTGSTAQSVKVTVTESPGTEYVILRSRPKTPTEGTQWEWIGTRTARTNEAALKAFLDDATTGDKIDGTYLSIPARTYKPIKITQQTVTTLKLEEAK
jgi:hypothetical protein